MKYILTLWLFFAVYSIWAQNDSCTVTKVLPHTPVISQGNTGTCWSFATTSFLESEIMRKGHPEINLSEMYNVYQAYLNKTKRYLMFHGNDNFDCGGQAHDVLDVVRQKGIVTFKSLPGIKVGEKYNHTKLDSIAKVRVAYLNSKKSGEMDAMNTDEIKSVLNEYIGKPHKKSKYENFRYTPSELRDKCEINPDEYVELTSFTHHPFYTTFVLEIPDNWSHGLYYNIPVDELVSIIKYSVENGYTVCWDGDTSEKTFTHRKGMADVPETLMGKVTQNLRQKTFRNRTTTDDHLMHIVGLSKNSAGKTCFYTKNSWGPASNKLGGYLHLTEDYVRLKTIAIMVNKAAIPEYIKTKLNL